jgi:hypothetical protein
MLRAMGTTLVNVEAMETTSVNVEAMETTSVTVEGYGDNFSKCRYHLGHA